MLAYIHKGGPLMWVLVALSVIACAIALDRALMLLRTRARMRALPRSVLDARLQRIWRGVEHLDLVSSIAPLVGLTGTVFGIITCFSALGVGDATPDPSLLATGLSQALLTTAAGLIIAVPAQVAAHILQQGVTRIEDALPAHAGTKHEHAA